MSLSVYVYILQLHQENAETMKHVAVSIVVAFVCLASFNCRSCYVPSVVTRSCMLHVMYVLVIGCGVSV